MNISHWRLEPVKGSQGWMLCFLLLSVLVLFAFPFLLLSVGYVLRLGPLLFLSRSILRGDQTQDFFTPTEFVCLC